MSMVKQFLTINTIVRIIACWAFVLGSLNLVNILILTLSDGLYNNRLGNQIQLWLILVFDVFLGISFLLSAYGLWLYKSWGRTLFLWLIAIWAGSNIISLVLGDYTGSVLAVNILRFAVTLLIPFWYLHRPPVEALFERGHLETQKLGE